MTIYEKLLEVQKEIGVVKKDLTNPYFKSKYFDINKLLEEIKPVLHKKNLLLLQGLNHEMSYLCLDTQIIDVETGEKISFNSILPDSGDAQKQGSAITYFRRYALQSLLALEAEDDDGNTARKPSELEKSMSKLGETLSAYPPKKLPADNDDLAF